MINEVLSSRLKVKPMKGSVTYKVKGAGEVLPGVVDNFGNKKLATPGLSLPGITFIKDKWGDNPTARTQIIHATEYESIKLPDGTTKLEPIPERINFINGYLNVTEDNFETYAALERSDFNGSNKYRDRTKPIKFYREDAKKIKLDKMKFNQRVDTSILLLRDSSKADVINIAKYVNKTMAKDNQLNLDQDLELLRGDIRARIVEKWPEAIIMGSSDVFEKKKIQAQIAEDFNVIEFNEVSRDWYYKEEVVAHADAGTDRYNSIAKKFQTPGDGAKLWKMVIDDTKVMKEQ